MISLIIFLPIHSCKFFKNEENVIVQYNVHTKNIVKKYYFHNDNIAIDPFSLNSRTDEHNNIFLYSMPELNITDSSQRYQFFSSKIITNYHLSDSSITANYELAPFPVSYKTKFYDENFPSATQLNDSTIAYLFSNEPKIYINSGIHCHEYPLHGVGQNKSPKYNTDSMQYFEYGSHYRLYNEHYFYLLYDSTNKYFYIFQDHPVHNTNSNELPLEEDKPVTLYVVDSNFNLKAKKDFMGLSDYVPAAFFCRKGKLYMGKIKNNQLQFDCYEIH